MANPSAPWLDDPMVNGPAPSSDTAPTAATPWASDPVIQPAPSKAALTQDDINSHVLSLLNDKRVTGQQIRDYYTSLSAQISEHDSKALEDRDAYIRANGGTPTIGVSADGAGPAQAPNLVDNRPYSFGEGVREGIQHVIGNVAGGAGWAANRVGLDNNWGDELRQHFHDLNAVDQTRGSSFGKVVGEGAAAAPAIIAAAPIETGAAAIGLPTAAATGLGLLATGGLTGALTTHSSTPGGVAKDAAIGAGLELGLGGLAHGFGNLAGTPTRAAQQGREVLDAADRLSRDGLVIQPLPGDVSGPLARGASAVADAGLVSNVPYSRAVTDYIDATQAARDRVASGLSSSGAVPDLHAVAGNARNGVGGLGDYETRSAEQIGRQYDEAGRLSAGVQIPAPRALATVNDLIARAEATPGQQAGLDALRALRDDLTPTPDQIVRPSLLGRLLGQPDRVIAGDPATYAIESLRRLRTSFGDNIDSNARAARTAANEIWGPLSDDIQSGLRSAGRDDAADAYRAADQAWSQRQSNLDEVVGPILGDRSQEDLARHLLNLSRTDSDRLNLALGIMRPDQAGDVRAAIVGNLGRSTPGRQNAAGDAFSLGTFGTDWAKLSDGTKSSILPAQAQQDLQDLARLSEGTKATAGYGNTSKTGRVAHALQSLGKLASGGAAYATLGKSLLAEGALGGLMSSPNVARALVRMGEIRPIARGSQALATVGQYSAPIIYNGTDEQP
jgi:hypothetical protein